MRNALTTALAGGLLLALSGSCNSGGNGPGQGSGSSAATLPDFTAATFTFPTNLTHPLARFPVNVERSFVADDGEDLEVVIVKRGASTEVIMGVECVGVMELEIGDDLLLEESTMWLAQDDAGNVWTMGEDVVAYEYDDEGEPIGSSTEGSWRAGSDVAGVGALASPGFLVPETPAVGNFFYQAHYPGVAMDRARVADLAVSVELENGMSFSCVKLDTSSTLDPSDTATEFHSAGVGLVLESSDGGTDTTELRGEFDLGPGSLPNFAAATFTQPDQITHPYFAAPLNEVRILIEQDDEETETIVLERVPGVRTVAGVDCAIIRDRVYFEGELKEDTYDWFAQDDAGNVWYMGEEVVNYIYDDDGKLIGTNNDGSWEAGLDPAGVGTPALPGFQLPAVPVIGQSFYQEFYPTEAIDMGVVEATDAIAELPLGQTISGCLRSLDWNPLDPGGLETKLYAPGIGLVAEEGLHSGASSSQFATYDLSASSIPNFAAASFTSSTLVDHPFFPLQAGSTWSYEADTEDGLETVEAEVLASTRIVAGVTCLVVHVEEFLDGVIQEETDDWFAQDDDGNVWYMGEEVENYEYDDNGTLIGTDSEGSWEAGLDVAGAGVTAQPGYAIPAETTPGATYFQEYYEGEAEDVARVVENGVTAVVDDVTYTGCVRTVDWNPLDGYGLEYKLYAPGIGVILEANLVDGDDTELVDTSLQP